MIQGEDSSPLTVLAPNENDSTSPSDNQHDNRDSLKR